MTTNLFILGLILGAFGIFMTLFGGLLVFWKPFYLWVSKNIWTGNPKVLSPVDSYNYNRYGRGLQYLFIGLISLVFAYLWLA